MLVDKETALEAGKLGVETIVEEEVSVLSVPSVCGLLEREGQKSIST